MKVILDKLIGRVSPSKEYMKAIVETYSCNTDKNTKCNKKYCGRDYCAQTTQYKYAKRTPINYIKKIINKIRGIYKYE